MSDVSKSVRPGPRRPDGKPSGPDEVRSAVLEAAASLFASRGIDAVSLRDVAAEAEVNPALISRYVGNRDQLLAAVFAHVSDELDAALKAQPLSGQGFTPDTPMGRWVRIAASMAISGHPMHARSGSNPIQVMAEILMNAYEMGEEAARLRAAQITAAALGWRIFEDYLIEAAGLDEFPLADLRQELARSARRLGATEWPSPPDPLAREV